MAEVRECRRGKEHYMMLFLGGDAFFPFHSFNFQPFMLALGLFTTRTTHNRLEIKAECHFFLLLQGQTLKAAQQPST